MPFPTNIRRPLLQFLLAAVVLPGIRAEPVESRLAAVTVYLDRAVVTRTAQIDIREPGLVEASFERLPAGLVDESLRVSGLGTAQASILDVTARSSYVDFTPDARVQAGRDEIRDLKGKRRILADKSAALKQREKSLGRIVGAETGVSPAPSPRLSLEDAAKLLVFLDEQRSRIASEQRLLDNEDEAVAAKLDAAERRLGQLRGAGGRSYKTVVVRIRAETAQKISLALNYEVPGASWIPKYDARVASADNSVRLVYSGVVRQNTGEDWNDAELTLSTARPALGGAPPSLGQWIVDVDHPAPAAPVFGSTMNYAGHGFTSEPRLSLIGGRTGGSGALGVETVSMAAFEVSTAPHQTPYAKADPQGQVTSTSFRIPTRATVLSDNSPERVPIAALRLAANPEYVAVPKLLPAAFLKSEVVNSSEYPLLAGEVSVFLDDTFVAAGSLRTVMPGEKFDLALGADDGIAVKRTLNRRYTEEVGLMTKGRRVTYDFTLTAENNKKAAETVVLLDQVPVSRNEKVKVELRDPKEDETAPSADGTMKWTLKLKPGEKRQVHLAFSVEYGNDTEVTGLE